MAKKTILNNCFFSCTSISHPKSADNKHQNVLVSDVLLRLVKTSCAILHQAGPSECVERHLVVAISTTDSCSSESQFFFLRLILESMSELDSTPLSRHSQNASILISQFTKYT